MNKLYLLIFSLVFLFTPILAQQPQIDEAQVRAELKRRGLEEDVVRKKLLDRGIDIDKVDPSNPAEVIKLQAALEEVQKEIEAEAAKATEAAAQKAADTAVEKTLNQTAKTSAEEIQDAVQEGTPLKEAISEELIDQQEEIKPTTLYGQQIFRNKSIKVYRQAEDIIAPDSYVLGAGDIVSINIWGPSQETATYTINKSGFIQPSNMPRINLKGIAFGKAKQLLMKRFDQYYRFSPEEFEVTLNYSRTITVNILGEAMNYGSFTLPAINTAFNALVAAGGPTEIGSVRNIALRRNGQSKRLDIYKFMLEDPTVQYDFYLEENDIIFIPVAERIVNIKGAVKRPFRYELIKGEELKKLIEYAGGFKANAYQTNLQVKRFIDDKEKIIDVNFRDLQKTGRDFTLLPGDEIIVGIIPKPYKNFAEINGAILNKGKYEITNGMRVADLVKKGVLDEDARMDVAFLLRINPDSTITYQKISIEKALKNPQSKDNLVLQPRDILRVLSLTNYADKATISIEGAVRNPSVHAFDLEGNLRVDDAITLAGGLQDEAIDFAYIKRTDPKNRKQKEYLRIDLKNALSNPNSSDNIKLKPFDKLVVYSYKEFLDDAFVKVEGAVRKPGEFQYDKSLTLKDALTLSGGLKLEAARSRIDISRVQISGDQNTKTIVATLGVDENYNIIEGGDNFQLEPYDQIYVRSAPEFEFQQNIKITGEIKYPGTYPLTSDNEKILSLIKRAGGLTKEAFPLGATLYRPKDGVGYIVMGLDEVLKTPNSKFNYILKEGDIIHIPKQKDFVTIKGATRAAELYTDAITRSGKINVPYHIGKSAKFYINEYAAGVGEDGRRRLITVEHPNGELKKTKNFLFFKTYPKVRKGSVITVGRIPKKQKEKKKEREDIDWGRVLADSLAQATAILSLILLVQRVN